MATIKSLLSTTLESFLTSKKSWTGQQAFPTGSVVNLTVTTTDKSDLYSITAPSDGWIVINCYRVNGASAMSLYGVGWGWGQVGSSSSYASVSAPVKKGDTFMFYVGNVDTSKTYVQFFKTVGSS